jgi:hypothetical protein
VFGVFFPAVTGISAGVSVSGDLKDPTTAIPKGTFIAIFGSSIVYIVMGMLMSASFTPEGLINIDTQIDAIDIAIVPGLVYAGLYAAALSSALALMIGCPRVFMALARDDVLPILAPFKKGYTAKDEPIRGYMLVSLIAFFAIITMDLNSVSPIATNFYLMTYCVVNLSIANAHFAKSPGWRPSYRFYSPWLSLFGALQCIACMFMVDWVKAIVTVCFAIIIYQYISYRKPNVNWGGSAMAGRHTRAIEALYHLEEGRVHVKNYRPQFLVLVDDPAKHPETLKFVSRMQKGRGVMIIGQVIKGNYVEKIDEQRAASRSTYLLDNKFKGFVDVVVSPNLLQGVVSLLQLTGLGKLKPNTVLLGYKEQWNNKSQAEVSEYCDVIRACFFSGYGVGVLRNVEVDAIPFASKLTIDVWWLVEDGGLTLLMPYLIRKHAEFRGVCSLRVFTLAPANVIESERARVHDMLNKFRIVAEVIVLEENGEPSQATEQRFRSMADQPDDVRAKYFMRLSDLIIEHSDKAAICVASLPIPRVGLSNRTYMSYLDLLSANRRPTILLRGNQESALSYHS